MNLINNSQKEWLEKGGSEDALAFIENVVGQLHNKAVTEGIVHKQVEEEVETVVNNETETEVTAETETEVPAETETVVTSENEVETTPVVEKKEYPTELVTLLVETVFAAQKQYHTEVVAPLVAELKAIKDMTTKTAQSTSMFGWDMSALLPAAAVADKIKKEFGTSSELTGTPVEGEAVVVKEVEVNANSSNLLAGF